MTARNNETVPTMTVERFFRPGEHFHMQISTDFPDYMGILHRHEYIEVVYVLSGSAVHTVEGRSWAVKRGDLCIINVDTVHMFCPDKAGPEPLVVYDLMFTPEFFDLSLSRSHSLEDLRDSYLFRSLPKAGPGQEAGFGVSETLHAKFSELFGRMYDEYRDRELGYTEIIRAYLLQVVVTAMRLSAAGDRGVSRSREQLVDRVLERIDADYAGPLGVRELADSVHLSPDYLGRVFKEVTGQTVTARIQAVRIQNACRLLATTQRTVADISAACGFGDPKNFYSAFKKQMGLSPGDYRKQNGE